MNKMPKGRTLQEFEPLLPAEQKLHLACRDGEDAEINKKWPTQTNDNIVRASFIRFLALGGDDNAPIHERGVSLKGAWIEGELDLMDANISFSLNFCYCRFESPPIFIGATISGHLYLSHSLLPGLEADRLQCSGDIFLRNGFNSTGTVKLRGAQISGSLKCDEASLKCNNAILDGKDDNALSMDGAIIKGEVVLSKGFNATGTVRLVGVQIGGNLDCTASTLNKGQQKHALIADGMRVSGAFFLQQLKEPVQGISLASAKVGRLIDDKDAWGGDLILDGFTYEHIAGNAPTDVQLRIEWLKKQTDFHPQPWKHLQTVLRDMGHVEEAKEIGIAFEDHLRDKDLIGQAPRTWPSWQRKSYRCTSRVFHQVSRVLMRYGYRPLRLLAWMVGVWLVAAGVYWAAALQGVMAPSNPLVFQHMPHYEKCSENWYLCEDLPEEYTGFHPLMYSLDVLLPLVNLQQEQDWAAKIPTPQAIWYKELFSKWGFKHLVRWVIWVEILFGWVASLLLVAVFSGLSRRSET